MNTASKAPKPLVLVVSRDDRELAQAGSQLTYGGYPNHLVVSGTEALCILAREKVGVLLLSTHQADNMDLAEIMRWVRLNHPSVRIQLMGGTSLIRLKAYVDEADAIAPRDGKVLPWVVALVEQTAQAQLGPRAVSAPVEATPPPPGTPMDNAPPTLIGRSPPMLALKAQLVIAAKLKRVLVRGDAGTGKEQVVQTIHWLSNRPGPLVPFNAGTFVDNLGADTMMGHEKGAFNGARAKQQGAFEEAHRGTLFVDEIGDLSLVMQVMFLRVLETGEVRRVGGQGSIKVDVMLIAATNKDLKREVAEGRFRADLYDRLTDFVVWIPRLSDRVEDIPELAQHFADLECRELRWPRKPIDLDAITRLKDGHYPGNLRSLRSAVFRAVVFSGRDSPTIKECDVDQAFAANCERSAEQAPGRVAEPLRVREDRARVDAISDALRETGNNQGEAARILEIDRGTLNKAMARLGMSRPRTPRSEGES